MATSLNHLQIVGAVLKPNGDVVFTLKEWNTGGTTKRVNYHRTYECHVDKDNNVRFPNDLTDRIQKLCVAVCLCLRTKNTREGDS